MTEYSFTPDDFKSTGSQPNILTLRANVSMLLSNSEMDTNFINCFTRAFNADAAASAANNLADDAYTLAQDNYDSILNINSRLTYQGIVAALGFIPVRQGGGTSQTDIQVNIGLSTGNRLLLQTGTGGTVHNFNDTWPINVSGVSAGAPWSGISGITANSNAYGNRYIQYRAPTAGDGANGDIWYQVG